MKRLLVISNHPVEKWDEAQKSGWDEIKYLPFPNINPHSSKNEVLEIADNIVIDILRDYSGYTVTVQGEFSLTCGIVCRLTKLGIEPIFPTTERVVVEKDGVKSSIFKFVQWR